MERRIEKLLTAYMPFPMCIINDKGKVTRASSRIDQVFIYDGIKDADIYALTGFKYSDFQSQFENRSALFLSRNDKIFKIFAAPLSITSRAPLLICFLDVTEHEALKTAYHDEKTCMAIVSIDNFDELFSNAVEDTKAQLVTQIDKDIRSWAANLNASIIRYRDHMYTLTLSNASCEKLAENKFSILDEIRGVETDGDFPITLSIGIGIDGKSPAKNLLFAQAALDLALGRGGDQAVIKKDDKLEYYGGKTQVTERSNKGRSRIMAHAITHLMDQSSKVMIMGHANPDMDSFGSALGVFRLAANIHKEAHIVINKYYDNLADIYKHAKDTGLYSLINSEEAMALADKDTLIVVVDTHRPSMTECPKLLTRTDKVVVIDHHRKAEDFIENATLAYMEPSASSTSELITEILQYSKEKKGFSKFEAEALLAGITVDTNRFAGRTGARTFEAASWLRQAGADTNAVKRFFQSDISAFKIKATCVANADFSEEGIAFSICEGPHPEMQILNAQAADILLEIKGIKASFVAGIDEDGKTVISARSLGDINVQRIMEEFDGGGHLMTAGAKVDMSPELAIEHIKEIFAKES